MITGEDLSAKRDRLISEICLGHRRLERMRGELAALESQLLARDSQRARTVGPGRGGSAAAARQPSVGGASGQRRGSKRGPNPQRS